MTRKTAGWMAGLGIAAATLLAVGAATAHGGYGPGQGMGCGAGYGPGPAAGAQGGLAGCGAYGQGMGGRGPALLTDDERAAHRAKMQSLASYDECKAYMADFSQQLKAKAKDKGVTLGGPNEAMCDRMQAHGRFTK